MGNPKDCKNKSRSDGEIFRAIVTDSQDSLEQPKGKFKSLFEKFTGKSNKNGGVKTLHVPRPSQGNNTKRKTSEQVE